MDPITIATEVGKVVVGKVATSAGGKFVDKAWDNASKWLKEKFKGHSLEVKNQAKENSESFLEETGKKLQIIVQNSQNSPVTIQLMDKNFKDPDFSAVLQEATLVSARTKSEEKHNLLARLIAERVTSNPESMISLVSSSAVEAIGKLAPKHLYMLGLTALIYQIRPGNYPKNLPTEILNQSAKNWWLNQITPLMTNIVELNSLDMSHLVSLSCVDYNSMFGQSLETLLKSGFGEWDTTKLLVDTEQGKKFKDIFDKNIQHITLTSTGMLIGIFVHDQLIGKTTTIDW